MLPFSERLKHETAEKHEDAETSTFIATLMKGDRSATDYARLIGQYVYIYQALEYAADRCREAEPQLTALLDPKLVRLPHLLHDYELLAAQHGLDTTPTPTAATAKYVARLHELSELKNPLDSYRILAHHYLRYLGDLSGGQIISTLVSRHYDVPENARTAWKFEGIDKLKTYKDQYRKRLTDAVSDLAAQDAIIIEAQHGFDLNRALFNSLDSDKELMPVS